VARLHSRIYIHVLCVLLVVGVVAATIFAVGARDAFRRLMAERMTRHIAALAAERLDDPAALAARLDEIHEQLGIDVTVRDGKGRLVASAGAPLPAVDAVEALARSAGGHPPHPGLTAAPLRAPSSGDVIGVVITAAPHPMRGRPMGMPSLWRPAIVLVAVLLGVALATRPLARRISRPLERLTEAARRLGGGDLSARVPEPDARWGADEITELTRVFNEMAGRVERLVHNEKELLANVSHELRSPLARIRVALELLPRDGDSARRLAEVERDLADLDRLIDDVLTTARLDATGLPTRLGAVDVRALLADLAERARHDPLTASTTVLVDEGPALDLTADGALLRRALWNLVENAAKYGVPPITLGAQRAGAGVELSVTDTGPGIAEADRERVFAPFYRGDAARTPAAAADERRGVGLGLTLARRIAEVHGGTIAIRTAGGYGQGRGCRVVITLPDGSGSRTAA